MSSPYKSSSKRLLPRKTQHICDYILYIYTYLEITGLNGYLASRVVDIPLCDKVSQ